ncbi:MAG: hypothetical protein NDJ94_07210 [Vicinamibacteria bacterium]|nr:hypothetical protein [Vicinamibacteria bacterium]
MKLQPARLALGLFLAAPVVAQQPAAVDPLARLGWFAQVAGHCYVGTLPDAQSKDTQCYSVVMGHAVRGTIQVERPGSPVFEGEGLFGWDKAAGRIAYVLVAPGGTFTPGEAFYEGERLLFPQRVIAGKPEVRSAWTREGDGYKVTRESRDVGGAWKTVFEVVYARVTP